MTTDVSDPRYDLRFNGQLQMFRIPGMNLDLMVNQIKLALFQYGFNRKIMLHCFT